MTFVNQNASRVQDKMGRLRKRRRGRLAMAKCGVGFVASPCLLWFRQPPPVCVCMAPSMPPALPEGTSGAMHVTKETHALGAE